MGKNGIDSRLEERARGNVYNKGRERVAMMDRNEWRERQEEEGWRMLIQVLFRDCFSSKSENDFFEGQRKEFLLVGKNVLFECLSSLLEPSFL